MINTRPEKIVIYIICANIIAITAYKIGGFIIAKSNLVFRVWIDELYVICMLLLSIMIIVFINILLCSKVYTKIKNINIQDLLKVISTVIMTISIPIVLLCGLFISSFSLGSERIVYKENQKLIARDTADGFDDITVDFFEPLNIFVMKKSNVRSEIK